MFKNFHGYHIVESYHKSKMQRRIDKSVLSKTLKIGFATLAMLILWLIPTESYGIAGLTIMQQRTIAIFVFATLMWIFEAVPSWSTSMIVTGLLLLIVSDSSLKFLTEGYDPAVLGEAVKYKSILHCFADPIIMLFIGGFILAVAATKIGLDVKLAKVMLAPFGTQSRFVLLGFLVVTGVFSMFLSNTATAAMMLTFLAPVLKSLPDDGKGKIGLAMAIPVAANIGGMGTPIGTPPNAIALKYLSENMGMNIGFGEWMLFMTPFAILLLVIGWFLLLKVFPFKQKTIVLDIQGETKTDWKAIVVYITFAITVIMWVLDKFTGVNANVVAMIPVCVFCGCGVISKRDLEEINWSVLWMVAGGFAIGVALNETGLADTLIEAIPFNDWSPIIVILGSGLLCYALSNFISNSATAALLVPILAIVGKSMANELEPFGGVGTLLLGIAMCASLAMVLPISTPPNALAHATGLIKQKDMERIGLIMGFIGMAIGYVILYLVGQTGLI